MPSTVQLKLQGLIAVFAKEHSNKGTVRILKSPPVRHQLTIGITQTIGSAPPTNVPFTMANQLDLNVQGATQTDITFHDPQPSLNRMDPSQHPRSFSWAVDLDQLYQKAVGARKDGFSPILTFNVGELSTHSDRGISNNHLQIARGTDTSYQDFGNVAVKISVDVSLDKAGSFATFSDVTFKESDNAVYVIDISHESPNQHHPKIVMDANYYYTAVGTNLASEEFIQFMSVDISLLPLMERLKEAQLKNDSLTEAAVESILKLMAALGPPAGPEAACFPAVLTQTDPT